MSDAEASRRGLTPLGIYAGVAVAGVAPDEMGIGPVFAVPKLLDAHGLTIDDIGLWELNEAFAVQALYCRDRLGIDPERYNVDGGGISVGHPYGMTGARLVGHAPHRRQAPRCEVRRRDDVHRRRAGSRGTLRSRLSRPGPAALAPVPIR